MKRLAAIACFALTVLAQQQQQAQQNRRTSRTKDSDSGGWIHGSVVDDRTSTPLLRAQVILRPVAGPGNSVLAETDEHGDFVLSRIAPGSYSLAAQRDGYLTNTVSHRSGLRMPAVIRMDQGVHLRDIAFRMQPWSVLAGRIRFNDAEPAMGAQIQLYREVVNRGRHSMRLVTSGRTNDRGEYRLAGLAPGAYYVAATRNRTVAPDLEEQEPLDEEGRPRREFRYATTFYPSAQKLADAIPVRLKSAQEITGIDIFLKPVQAVRLRGHLINGINGQKITPPSVSLRRLAAGGQASINVPIDLRPYDDGFEILGVTSGPYLLAATVDFEGKRLTARKNLTVTDSSIDDISLLLRPPPEMTGQVQVDASPAFPVAALRFTFEPRSDMTGVENADVSRSGTFKARLDPDEHYDLYMLNSPADYYVKSVRLANADIGPEGIPGIAASPNVTLTVTLSSKSAKLLGRVFLADGQVAGGAVVSLVPDPPGGRERGYQTVFADEYGLFRMSGIPPGRYSAFAYYDESPCDLYDEESLVACRSGGKPVLAEESGQSVLELRLLAQ